MTDADTKLQSEIIAAVKRSIQAIGKDGFKKTTLFGSAQDPHVSQLGNQGQLV